MSFEYKGNHDEMYKDYLWRLEDAIRGKVELGNPAVFYACSFALLIAQRLDASTFPEQESILEEIQDENTRIFVEHYTKNVWRELGRLYMTYNDRVIIGSILSPQITERVSKRYGVSPTPEAINSLVNEILNIQDEDTVADFGAGYGAFLFYIANKHQSSRYTAIELSSDAASILRIRAELSNLRIEVIQDNMFSLLEKNYNDLRFNKIFSNYPLGLPYKVTVRSEESSLYLASLNKRITSLSKADWAFNSLIVDRLLPDGKGIGVMTLGSTFNHMEKNVREYFIYAGLIEAVIELPGNLLLDTSIPICLIVFSQGNKSIRLVNANELYQKGKPRNVLTTENIDHILYALSNDCEISKMVTIEEFENEDWCLLPSRYFTEKPSFSNGVKLGELIKSINRGASISSNRLEDIKTNKDTGIKFLQLASIKDSRVLDNLPYINTPVDEFSRYYIEKDDFILAKNGNPFKYAVIYEEYESKIIANGNLYIIKLDTSKLLPQYLAAFFDSEEGQKSLKQSLTGTTIPIINTNSLKEIIVPVPSMKAQKEVARIYEANLDEAKALTLKLELNLENRKLIYREED